MRHGVSAIVLTLIFATQIVGSQNPRSKTSGPTVDLGELNKNALYMPIIAYPPAAREAGVNGIVKIRVFINKAGSVVRTAVVSGPKLLQQVSLAAARKSKFPPNLGDCESCRYVTGILVYTFMPVPPKQR